MPSALFYRVMRPLRRLRKLLGRRSFERELEEELRFHMDMAASRHAGRGRDTDEVRFLTHRQFGPMAQYKDEIRDARGMTTFDDIVRDLRFALRTLLRTPGFTIVAL